MPATAAQAQPVHSKAPRMSPAAGPVLIACDGSPVHDALFNAARLAGEALQAPVQVLGVCERTPTAVTSFEVVPISPELDEMRRAAMLEDVRRAVSIASAGDTSWPVDVKMGSPARILAAEASLRGAGVIVMGIGRHNPLDRLFGAETTLATLRESHVPVLAVGANFSVFPRHAVVGMDFSSASLRAAQLALAFVGASGRLTLVHVRPRFDHPTGDWQLWDAEYGRTLPPLFEKVRSQLNAPDTAMIETITVRGDPAPALLAFAQQSNADLIAVGTQRHSLLERLIVGSVATRVLRTARCAVLAAPSPLVPGAAGTAPAGLRVHQSDEPGDWAQLLATFSQRNAGRLTHLAVDDRAVGAFTEERGYTLTGASYDRVDQRVQFMFTHPTISSHLTHTQPSVHSVAVFSDATGVEQGLKLVHAHGETLLTFLHEDD